MTDNMNLGSGLKSESGNSVNFIWKFIKQNYSSYDIFYWFDLSATQVHLQILFHKKSPPNKFFRSTLFLIFFYFCTLVTTTSTGSPATTTMPPTIIDSDFPRSKICYVFIVNTKMPKIYNTTYLDSISICNLTIISSELIMDFLERLRGFFHQEKSNSKM